MTENNQEDYVILWEQPKLEPPEFRLYYDDKGKVICYTGDKSVTGDYIVIDALTFAAARPDVRVIDGKISTVAPNAVVYKLMPNDIDGIECHSEDISIVVDNSYTDKKQKWKLTTYEL
jgi:hypothetical protein